MAYYLVYDGFVKVINECEIPYHIFTSHKIYLDAWRIVADEKGFLIMSQSRLSRERSFGTQWASGNEAWCIRLTEMFITNSYGNFVWLYDIARLCSSQNAAIQKHHSREPTIVITEE